MKALGVAARLGALLLLVLATGLAASAEGVRFFRIGTGGTAGTYYPIGGLIANAISSPPGSRPCEEGGSCGVPGLIAVAISSNGSVSNVKAIAGQSLEAALVQSDVGYWAHSGTGVFEGGERLDSLRAVANLYPESVHLVARKGAGIRSVADLKGKRVSLDEPGSGTLVDARLILQAWGLSEKQIKAEYLKPNQAGAKMRDGLMDAFFFVGGFPAAAVEELAKDGGIDIVPIEGPEADALRAKYPFFAEDRIPAHGYGNPADVRTLSVGAQLLVGAQLDEELIYGITQALWNDATRALLESGHGKGKAIRLETALDGIGIPLHPGAERFYREVGLIE